MRVGELVVYDPTSFIENGRKCALLREAGVNLALASHGYETVACAICRL